MVSSPGLDHARRAKGMGGSDAATLLGEYGKPYRMWELKTGRAERSQEETEAMYWGTQLEPLVAARYCEVTGRKVRRQPMLESKTHHWMLANVDRQIVGDPRGPGILECKTANAWGGFTDEATLPSGYYAQLQHYLAVTGYSWGSFAILIGGQRFHWFDVDRNQEYIDALIEAEAEFWQHVETDTPPELTARDLEIPSQKYPVSQDIVIELPAQTGTLLLDYIDVQGAVKAMKEREAELKARIQMEMGVASVALAPGIGKATWKSTKDISKEIIDTDMLRTQYPDVALRVITRETVPGSRRFVVTREK